MPFRCEALFLRSNRLATQALNAAVEKYPNTANHPMNVGSPMPGFHCIVAVIIDLGVIAGPSVPPPHVSKKNAATRNYQYARGWFWNG
jgi:hypothetical protein